MKKILLFLGLALLLPAVSTDRAAAQQINIQINIGRQPAWGPVGYDYVRYYYFPELNVYFDVPASLFYYLQRGRWIASRYLPPHYRRYDLYRTYKVVLNSPNPWVYNRKHKRQYARYRNDRRQAVIRDSRDDRYRSSRSNDIRWVEEKRPARPAQPQRHPPGRNEPQQRRDPDRGRTPDKRNKNRDRRGDDYRDRREREDRR